MPRSTYILSPPIAENERKKQLQAEKQKDESRKTVDEEDGRRLGFASNWYDDVPAKPSTSITAAQSAPSTSTVKAVPRQLNSSATSESSVVCITHDFAMQNILLQMGIRLLSLSGNTIRSVRYWIKKCHACFAYTSDMNRQFCEQCGHHTMIRVNVALEKISEQDNYFTDDQGLVVDGFKVRMWHGWRHLNTRGTVYSIPTPQGGRHSKPLKLAEAQMDNFHRRQQHHKTTGDGCNDGLFIFNQKPRSGTRHVDVYG